MKEEEFVKQAGELMSAIDDPRIQAEVSQLQAQDPMEELRQELVAFFKNRISSIQRSEKLKELVYEWLTSQIQGGDLNFDQMMSILSRLDVGANQSADSIISMFRPTASGQSALSEIVRTPEDKSDIMRAFDGYSSEDLQAIEKTMHSLRMITEGREQKSTE